MVRFLCPELKVRYLSYSGPLLLSSYLTALNYKRMYYHINFLVLIRLILMMQTYTIILVCSYQV
jgi:hypothetical protein